MPISTLDSHTALIVIDLQKGLVANPMLISPIDGIIASATTLAAGFRARGLPVVLASIDGGPAGRNDYARPARPQPDDFTDLVPELDEQPGDVRVIRTTWGAFIGTDLDATLKAMDVTQVVIAGIMASFGVESTARQALDYGYNVVVVTDATTDMSPDALTNSVTRVFPALGETGTTSDVLALLDAR
ncbi:cysteine hydrolase family protein [Glaciihabitans sp. dw_435]|uniref:cysteine hydrolase family protein n=1 Tax=Glaciihabitans sp. dw_435 TaxID=2720081 RepID=UPI001BD55A5D|nr:isochorismatase family cysteine hydrolase [Glaciihabitans sp. dw_435]